MTKLTKPTKGPKALSARQERFAREYVANGCNGARAALAAGYGPGYGGARVQAHRLLERDDVRALVAELTAEVNARLKVTAEKLIDEHAAIAFADVGDLFDGATLRGVDELDPITRRAIKKYKVRDGEIEVELHNKQASLDSLMRHKGMLQPDQGGGDTIINYFELPARLPEAEWMRKYARSASRPAAVPAEVRGPDDDQKG